MLFYLLPREELQEILAGLGYAFGDERMERTVEYDRARTSHGCTLSRVVYASAIHHMDCEAGCELFLEVLRSDVDDLQGGTTAEGIHVGAMAGSLGIVSATTRAWT
jgi:alpha,alpha-trehalase